MDISLSVSFLSLTISFVYYLSLFIFLSVSLVFFLSVCLQLFFSLFLSLSLSISTTLILSLLCSLHLFLSLSLSISLALFLQLYLSVSFSLFLLCSLSLYNVWMEGVRKKFVSFSATTIFHIFTSIPIREIVPLLFFTFFKRFDPQEILLTVSSKLCSVTRLCEILSLLQKFKRVWQFFLGLFSIWQNFEPTLAIL